MPIWRWKERCTDIRECAVEADTEEEARAKMESGDWLYEQTVDFYHEELVEKLNGPHYE